MRPAAFFDMDRTLLRIHTAPLHARFMVSEGFSRKRDLALPGFRIALFGAGILDDPQPAMLRVARLCAGLDASRVKERARTWVSSELATYARPAALRHLEGHRKAGDLLVLLTSSLSFPAEQIAEQFGIPHVLSNILEIGRDGRYTGNLHEPLCFGEGKAQRVLSFADEQEIDLAASTFYTDQHHDLPALLAVGKPRPVNPDRTLKRQARSRGWPVLYW